MKRILATLCALLWGAPAWGQTVIQGGSWSAGRAPMYSTSGGASQPIVQQSAPASGGSQSISEMSLIARGTGTAPYVGQGTGFLGSIWCAYDGPTTGAYRQLCLSPSATGSYGLLSYNAYNGASALPFKMNINGTLLEFPFSTSGVVGPGSSTVGHMATWANTSGTLLADGGAPLTIGGSNGQLEYNNSGALGGFTMAGDCTISVPNITCSKSGGQTISLGGALTTAGAFTTSGANPLTLTTTGSTSVTLPTTGTLSTLAGSEALTNKTYNGLTINATTGTFALTNGKTLTVSNTLGFTGTDGSTLNIGTGGTLGTAAYTASTAYVPSNTQLTASLGAPVSLNNTANYFDGPSVAQGSTGTWFASAGVSVGGANGDSIYCKLWDGTTVIASGAVAYNETGTYVSMLHLSGILTSPAANIKVSCRDATSATGTINSNTSGNSKDTTLTVFRVN